MTFERGGVGFDTRVGLVIGKKIKSASGSWLKKRENLRGFIKRGKSALSLILIFESGAKEI